jgi:hypothetical protein
MTHTRTCAAVGAVAVILSAFGAGVAHADPALHCEASALRAGVAGQPAVEPVTSGRDGACATAAATPSVSLPMLLDAQALYADTNYDGPGASGSADGGIAHLRVLPTPDLISRLPTEQAIDQLPNQTVTIPAPLAIALAAAGQPTTLQLDIRDAVRALVPTPGTALLSVDLLNAHAAVACQSGAPALSGSRDVVGVKLLGQDVGVDAVVTQALTLIDTQHIALSSLDVSKIHIVTPLDGITQPLLAQVQAAIGLLLAALPPIQLPASVIDAKLTPGEQIIDGATLTQRALHASLALGGQPVLDAVLGEAKVGAADGTCAPPATTAPSPPLPVKAAPKPAAAATLSAGQGSVADQILACTDRKLVLVDVLRRGNRVRLLGAANRNYVGRRVAIRLRATGHIVAHAIVRKDGSFETTAPIPPAAYLATHKRANLVRYRAEIGKELSLPLKLQRRLVVSSLTAKAGKVTITGRVVPPLTTPVSEVRIVRRVSCHKVVLVKRFTPGADGRFRVTVKAPKGQTAAVYRLVTRVREKLSNPRTYPTFTLPRGVALTTR